MRNLNRVLFALIALFAGTFVKAQQPAASDAEAAPVMYVKSFQAVQEPSGSERLLSRLRSATHAKSAAQNAAALSRAIVEQLSKSGLSVRYLAPGERVPASGWLIGGIYYSRDPGGHVQSWLQSGSGSDSANVEVTVTIADAAVNPEVPFAAIGAEDAIRAQGTVASWNPYIVAAKFVFKKVEGALGDNALAKDIADQIVGNLQRLRQQDVNAQPR